MREEQGRLGRGRMSMIASTSSWGSDSMAFTGILRECNAVHTEVMAKLSLLRDFQSTPLTKDIDGIKMVRMIVGAAAVIDSVPSLLHSRVFLSIRTTPSPRPPPSGTAQETSCKCCSPSSYKPRTLWQTSTRPSNQNLVWIPTITSSSVSK